MADEYIRRAEALEITTRTCGDYAAAFAEIRKLPAADVAEVVHEDETTQIIDGCCTACGAFMDCCEAAEYKFCPYCAKRIV